MLRAGHTDYLVNDAALAYMREHALAATTIARLAEHPDKQFADLAAWQAHLERLGEATVGAETYRKLHDAHRLVADVVCFKGPHINHRTPRTLDIDTVQAEMPKRASPRP